MEHATHKNVLVKRLDAAGDTTLTTPLSSPTGRKHTDGDALSSVSTSSTSGKRHVMSPLRSTAVSHCGVRSKLCRIAAFILVVGLVLLVFLATTTEEETDPPFTLQLSASQKAEKLSWSKSTSVMVAHDTPLSVLDATQMQRYKAKLAGKTTMRRTQLPSWTMHVVEAACAECLDSATHAAAVKRQRVPVAASGSVAGAGGDATVFATPSAPLGLAGPMLFAMASVTDDVGVGAELARWSWVPRSYAMRRQFSGASRAGLSAGTSPYLVVLGIPSTDQPVRSSLRDAQRDTWLSYVEVARSGNDFRGALLPLYIFAAAERKLSHGVTDVSSLLPTVAEYEAASTAQHLVSESETVAVPSYSERRVELVPGVGTIGAGDAQLLDSPCLTISSRAVSPTTDSDASWLSALSSALLLPVRPAAVAPAEFICHASTALWQEALAHRNMLWIDMMTDRRPTSGKRIGQGGNWGLPVEVGMTQKTILWLEYAYHAFPDVPYIMKGDDDTYLKVPQFLRDIRYIRGGYTGANMVAPAGQRDPVDIAKTEECIYWGSRLRSPFWGHLRYHAGSGYMLHRRLVQVGLEPSDRLNSEAVRLAVTPFKSSNANLYKKLVMNIEDAFVGRMLRDKRWRIRAVCPFHRGVFIEEGQRRHFDLHMGIKVVWSSVLVHHCKPADEYYLHYYFQHEHSIAEGAGGTSRKVDRKASAAAKRWMSSHVAHNLTGYGRSPVVRWTHRKNSFSSHIPEGDNVSVYSVPYASFRFRALDKARRAVVPK